MEPNPAMEALCKVACADPGSREMKAKKMAIEGRVVFSCDVSPSCSASLIVYGGFDSEAIDNIVEVLHLLQRRIYQRSADAPPRPSGLEGASNEGQPPVGQKHSADPLAPPSLICSKCARIIPPAGYARWIDQVCAEKLTHDDPGCDGVMRPAL